MLFDSVRCLINIHDLTCAGLEMWRKEKPVVLPFFLLATDRLYLQATENKHAERLHTICNAFTVSKEP